MFFTLWDHLFTLFLNSLEKFLFQSYIKNKFKDIKLSLEYIYRKSPKDPKNPKNPYFSWIFGEDRKKKDYTDEELKFRIERLKNETFKSQSVSISNSYDLTSSKSILEKIPLSKRRGFKGSIELSTIPKYSVQDQIINTSEVTIYLNILTALLYYVLLKLQTYIPSRSYILN